MPERKLIIARAKLAARILTDFGMPVSSPDDDSLDDIERERWNACIEIARRLTLHQIKYGAL